MIPGDIDLTENLDFRKVVRKQLPQLPDKWKKNNLAFEKAFSTISTTTGSLHYGISDNFYISTSNNNITYSDYNSSSYAWRSYNGNTSNITISYSNENNLYFSDNYTLNATYVTNNGNTQIYINKKEPEYDVFGNKKIIPSEIPKIPWDKKIDNYPRKNIAWGGVHVFKFTEPDIPWENIETTSIYDDGIYLGTKYHRAKHLISWLRKTSRSFIEKYLNPDKDDVDLSYLTNMSWIRVRDAVVDY